MKQLLSYLSKDNDFNEEHQKLVKIQIDNSIELGWKREDILLVANFNYEYQGVKAIVIPTEGIIYPGHPNSTKISVASYLIKKGIIGDGLYWLHDFDLYQQEPLTEEELELDGNDIGITNYGRTPCISTAMLFFRKSALDIFEWVDKTMRERKMTDERTLWSLILKRGLNCRNRIKLLNNTYNFMCLNVLNNYAQADKPLKCLHFHPEWNKLDFFMRGKSRLNKVLMTERLIRIFNKHGIK